MIRRLRLVVTTLEVAFIALAVERALHTEPLDKVLSVPGPLAASAVSGTIPVATLERAIRVVYRILPLELTCLKHSLVFCRFRWRRGLPAALRIGVQKEGGVFAAHAWVEDGSGAVLTDPQEGFTELPLPRTRAD